MKMYAVVEMCDDDYYPHYKVLKVFLNMEDAQQELVRLTKGEEYVMYSLKSWDVS